MSISGQEQIPDAKKVRNTEQVSSKTLWDIVKSWLPTDFFAFIYGVLTFICTIYAFRMSNSGMLITIWSTTAGYITVNKAGTVIHRIRGSSSKKTRTQQ